MIIRYIAAAVSSHFISTNTDSTGRILCDIYIPDVRWWSSLILYNLYNLFQFLGSPILGIGTRFIKAPGCVVLHCTCCTISVWNGEAVLNRVDHRSHILDTGEKKKGQS